MSSPAKGAAAQRDVRIDALRGFFILSLCVSHFGWFSTLAGYTSGVRLYDYQPFGFSSPAEFFVFFSGYVMALVLNRAGPGQFWLSTVRCLKRAWELYVLNIFTMMFVIAIAAWLFVDAPALKEASGLTSVEARGLGYLWRAFTLQSAPAFFEILRNYIYFIPLTPIIILLARHRPLVLVALSVTIWASQIVAPEWRTQYATFNPFSWQLIYAFGGLLAVRLPITEWRFTHRPLILGLIGLFLIAALVAKVLGAIYLFDVPMTNKAILEPLRLLHFGVLLVAIFMLIPSSAFLNKLWFTNWFSAVGKNSLECFCSANVVIYVGAAIFSRVGLTLGWYVVLQTIVVATIAGLGLFYEWIKAEPWRRPASKPS